MAGGRPEEYTKEIGDKICELLSEGISLRTVCLAEDMPTKQTVFSWMRKHKEFLDQYARAKEESADADAETLEIIGDEAIQEAKEVDPKAAGAVVSAYKLKADNIKWAMSKKKPKKYGDKLDVTSGNKPIPLLNVLRDNNSGKENSETQEEN